MARVSERRVPRRWRGERRITYALKVLALVTLAAVMGSAVIDFLGRIPSVVVVLVGATFFTYAIYPLVHRLNTRMPLLAAILVVYASIASVVGFGLAFVAPALAADVQRLVSTMPAMVAGLQRAFEHPSNPLITHLPNPVRLYLAAVPPQVAHFAHVYAANAATQLVALVVSVASLVATIVVIPVLSIYLMIEAPDLANGLVARLPPPVQRRSAAIVRDLDRALGGFIRGQLLVGATIGACIMLALLILHVRYAVLIGVAAGLLDVIPYVGAIVGFIPSVGLAFIDDGWRHAAIVAIVFIAIFQAEGHFIAPKIVSDSVGLSPLMVIVAILIGGELLGIGGMFLAVPIAAAVRVLVLHAFPARPVAQVVPDTPGNEAAADPLRDTAGVPGELGRPTAPEKAERVRA